MDQEINKEIERMYQLIDRIDKAQEKLNIILSELALTLGSSDELLSNLKRQSD
jgi:hypothetical protein